jgi:hypothetical protein
MRTILSILAMGVPVSVSLAYLVARVFAPVELTVEDILNFSEDVPTSTAQMQKAFDWKISQLSSLGNTVLTATLAFVSTSVVEFYKDSFKRPDLSVAVFIGTSFSLCLYLWCQARISHLRNEFVALYALLAFLRGL